MPGLGLIALLLASVLPHSCGRVRGDVKRRVVPTIDVVIYANPAYAVGVAAAINSSRVHTKSHVRFFIGYDGDVDSFLYYLTCLGIDATDV